SPRVADWTNQRTNPTARERTVIAASIPAAPATPDRTRPRRPGRRSVTGRPPRSPPAPLVDGAQRRRAVDDLGEAHLLAEEREPDDGGERTAAQEPGGVRGEGGAERRTERVGAGVPEHGPLGEVVGQAGGRGPEHGGGDRCARSAGEREPPGGEARGLERAAGPQVEEVEEVRGGGDEGGVRRAVRGPGDRPAAPGGQHEGGDEGAAADARDLQRAGRHVAVPQRGEVPAQPLDVPVPLALGEVVDGAERPTRPGGHGGGHPGPSRAGEGEGRAGGLGQPAEQAHPPAGVVRPLPAGGTTRGTSLE